jgi:hypothetical protein
VACCSPRRNARWGQCLSSIMCIYRLSRPCSGSCAPATGPCTPGSTVHTFTAVHAPCCMKSFVPTEQCSMCSNTHGVLRKQFCPCGHTAMSCRAQVHACMHAFELLRWCAVSGAARTRSCNKVFFLGLFSALRAPRAWPSALDVQLLLSPRGCGRSPQFQRRDGPGYHYSSLPFERKTGASSDTGLAADHGAAEPSITIVVVGRSIEGFAQAGTRAICGALDNLSVIR